MSDFEKRLQESANYATHKNIELVGEGQLAYCRNCKGGEAELYAEACIPRQQRLAKESTPNV